MRKSFVPLALVLAMAAAGSAAASHVTVNKIHVKNNSVGDAQVKVIYDCDKNGDGTFDEKKEAYACQLGLLKMEGNQNIAAGQDGMIGASDIDGQIANGRRVGLKISNGAGQNCSDRHPPDGDDVIYDSTANNKINFKVTGDAISGLSCHFQKD